jgi:hypothetical protein
MNLLTELVYEAEVTQVQKELNKSKMNYSSAFCEIIEGMLKQIPENRLNSN